ncbi:MAG TPA: AAA family ATPase [Lactovum miscens]|uniref:AAA family ATPase n=1 Tax=Lactovum miscens TaxID=190387 RepID=UPI002ED82B9F
MFKDVTTLKMSGANFNSLTSFDFFNPHDGNKVKTVKGALLYGRNGTGKSTIARAFRKLAGGNVPVITSAAFYDDAGHPVTLTEEEKKHIFIFNEDYVDKNVRLQQDHLETIVMLGQAADLTEKIEKAGAERDTAKTAYDQQDAVYKEYCDASNVKSPKHYISLLVNALRGDDNWAGRDREINNGRQNTGVKDDAYKKFVTLTPSKPKTELIADYKAKLKELEAAKTGASTVDVRVPSVPDSYITYKDETVQLLLAEKIEKPELSEREKKLFELLQDGRGNELSKRLTVFRKKETVECPYCFQSVTPEHREALVESIETVLSKAVESHQKALQGYISDQIIIDLNPYEKFGGYQTCVDLIAKINTAIQESNDNLKKKIENSYEPIVTKTAGVKTVATQLITALEDLEKARTEYNKAAKKTDPIIKELNRINCEIAHYDVADLAEQLDKQQDEYVAAEKLYKELKAAYDTKKKAIDDLETQRKNIRIALDAINACMKYIFFADDRLKIEYVDGAYKLLSHGKSVKPCDVSVGERNIIGLSYFFTSILEGQEEEHAYDEEYLLVIDDPVSSYDTENKIGILSFLKYKLSVFLEGNPNTRALVMTHDLMTFYDVHKLFEEIVDVCKQKGYPQDPKFNRLEMRDGGLKTFSYNNRQEYTEILKAAYTYASGQANDYELVIGNMMRQALEAFSTFEYKKGIEAVSTDAQILGLLPEPEYVSYYKNLMYRLVLHGGSHKEEQIKAMKDFQFFSLISETEKKRTAKDVLCFIYLLNKRHLLEHLKDSGNIEPELQSWCQDIKTRAAVI